MSGRNLFAVAFGSIILAACGGAEAVVVAEIEDVSAEGESTQRPLANMEVRLIPYDRDQIFDSLTAVAPRPEPQIPDTVLALRTEMAAAEEEWRETEQQWAALRDNLQQISREMAGLNRGEGRYITLFRDFQDQESRVTAIERRKDAAFARFDQLQQQSFQQAEEIRLLREAWADEAFADFDAAAAARLSASGNRVVIDTTDASGVVTFEAPAGQWWVYSRYDLPFNELYWNVPIVLQKGEPAQVRLHRGNAEVRPKL